MTTQPGKEKNPIKAQLASVGACYDSKVYAGRFKDPQNAWDKCKRSEWLLWLLGRVAGSAKRNTSKHRKLFLCLADLIATLPALYDKPFANNPELDPEFEAAQIEGVVNDLRLYGLGQIDIEEITLPEDVYGFRTFTSMLQSDIKSDRQGYNEPRIRILWYYADEVCRKFGLKFNDEGWGDNFNKAYNETNAKLADIVRQHFPTPPTL